LNLVHELRFSEFLDPSSRDPTGVVEIVPHGLRPPLHSLANMFHETVQRRPKIVSPWDGLVQVPMNAFE
jgi:hypothetical protein